MISGSKWRLVHLVLAAAVGNVWATSDDDFRRGLEAFNRGDVATAMSVLRAPAKASHAASQTLLAFILDRADFPEEAARLYREAATQGDAEAHAGLGNLYLAGRGIAKDEKLALVYFSKAAELGHVPSMQALADAYLRGQMGLDKATRDDSRAVAAFVLAADKGYLPAAEALALAYRNGEWGVATDTAAAAKWQSKVNELRKQRPGAGSKTRP